MSRAPVDRERLDRFLAALGAAASRPSTVYLVGGASALLLGFRASTLDVDLKLVPDSDELLRAIVRLKEELSINVELASPDDFIPLLPGWEDRSPFVTTVRKLTVRHFDFYSQFLAKVERSHGIDREDVAAMRRDGLVEPARVRELFARIEPELFRYPAVDPESFRERLDAALA